MKLLLLLGIVGLSVGCNGAYKQDWGRTRHFIVAGFQTRSFKNGIPVGSTGQARIYHYDQVRYNEKMDCDSFIIQYHDPINKVFTFVKQKDSTWLLIK